MYSFVVYSFAKCIELGSHWGNALYKSSLIIIYNVFYIYNNNHNIVYVIFIKLRLYTFLVGLARIATALIFLSGPKMKSTDHKKI